MGVYVLKLTASLEGVTNLKPLDTPENPFEYTFQIECTACREVHPKPVTINCFESHDLNDSKGAASFEFKCRNCTKTHSASMLDFFFPRPVCHY